jgi:uncharacterized membrane protein
MGPGKWSAEGPSLQRVVTLTDAVVAIAMTLLVLPLVELADEMDTGNPRRFFVDHADVLLSFAVSFVVVYVFWAAHGSALRRVEAADVDVPGLRLLNLGWLLVIAFLPFPTAVVGRELDTTSAPIYVGTMLTLSALTSTIVTVVDRATPGVRRGGWAWLTTAVFAACTLLSLLDADLGMFSLLGLALVRLAEVRAGRVSTAQPLPDQHVLGNEGAAS